MAPDSRYSPRVLAKITHAGVSATSYEQAARDLKALAEVPVSTKQVQRVTLGIGGERITQRDAQIAQWRGLSIPERLRSPREQTPDLAVVQMDGGRIQIFDRPRKEPAAEESAASFWRETKVGCLLTMHSEVHAQDPCPEIPASFVNAAKMRELAGEIHSGAGVEEPPTELAVPAAQRSSPRPGAPQPLVRTVIASMAPSNEFGEMLAAAAWARGFFGAPRKAFLGDGSAAIWGVWRACFSHYEPIVDFIHAIAYVFGAALAGRSFAAGWDVHRRWAQLVWSGRVAEVIAELEQRQAELGLPGENDGDTAPCRVVAETLTYLRNQQSRMRYDAYRRQGLPITTSHMESTVKQVSRRVKGSEKFWSTSGAEAMLQLRGDHLSDTQPLDSFWQTRQAAATGQRHYRPHPSAQS